MNLRRFPLRRPSPAVIVTLIALFVTLSGGAAAGTYVAAKGVRAPSAHVGEANATATTLASPDPPLAFLVFYGGGEHGEPERGSIFAADVDGHRLRRLTAARDYATEPAWSPHARRIAYVDDGWILVMDWNGRHRRRIVKGCCPRWSPNGKQLASGGRDYLAIVDVATRKIDRLYPKTDWVYPAVDWSPDGRAIAFTGTEELGSGHTEIYTIKIDGRGFRKLVSAPPDVSLDMPRWAPNGKRLLYTWQRNRTFIYVANADGSNARRLIPTEGDARASWSWDGRRIVYGVVDIRLLNLRTGARRKIDLPPCRRYTCQELDWSRTR